ncbi:putative disease resistance RPP13-like protein 2 [Ricinus communis]|uniref:ATP binding protein, putative n=1 Tax=Ricinus communis TaxID=3988 RepID=B9SU29_RICCO|nr:putative disease resistance RPP13-like protein 2 [Ricinus communis]EEF32908.1 ATP binding protein, putative [Ricinus communis]|eukprot:XP_002529498.1 putative disease resistance RPP13-like protein 2 [Ricinus communis]
MMETTLSLLADLIIQEADLITGVQEQVDFMESELRMMYAVLQDVEALEGPSDYLLRWNEIVEKANLNADNAIEKFITSAQNKGLSVIFLIFQYLKDRHDVGMQLNRIKASIREMPDSEMRNDKFNKSAGTNSLLVFFQQLIETNGVLLPFNVIREKSHSHSNNSKANDTKNSFVSSFIEGVKMPFSRSLIPVGAESPILQYISHIFSGTASHDQALRRRVDLLKRDMGLMLTSFGYVEGMEGLDERQMIWVAQLKHIADHVDDLDQKYSTISIWEVHRKIEQIECEVADLNRRKQNYAIEISVQGRGPKSVIQSLQERDPSFSISLEETQTFPSHHSAGRKQLDSDSSEIIALEEDFQSGSSHHGARNKTSSYDSSRIITLEEEKAQSGLSHHSTRSKTSISGFSHVITMEEEAHPSSSPDGASSKTSKSAPFIATFLEAFSRTLSNWFCYGSFSIMDSTIKLSVGPGTGNLKDLVNLKDQVKSMETEATLMRALLEDFQAIDKPSRRLNVWLEQIGEIADEAERAIKDYEKISQVGLFNYEALMIRNKIVNAITRIMNKIHDVSERREVSNTIFRSLCQRGPPPNTIGFDNDACAIKKRLLTGDIWCCVISIVGEVGTGKTTLAKLVYSDSEVMDHFPLRAWVPVHQENNYNAVVQEIREQFMGSVKENSKRKMGEEALVALNGRHLIILDDIRTAEVLDCLRTSFPDKSNGSRIVVTTNEMAVALHADSNKGPHEIQLLSDEESLELFTSTLKVEIPPDLEDIAKEIVRRCGWIRKNTVVVGNLLSKNGASRENFLRVLKQFNEGLIPWQKAENVYMELGRNLRKCLVYFRLFPNKFEIPARRLITLWVAEGFVNKRMGDEPEHIARRYLNELIKMKLVDVVKKKFDGDVKTCSLSKDGAKLLQEYADATSGLSSSIEISRFADHYDPNDLHFKHIHGHDHDSLRSHYKAVLSFMSFDHRGGSKPGEDIKKFLQRCISSRCFLLLRVLDLERVFRPKFPNVFGKLLQLRYLGLRWTYLEELPLSISNLLKLQTLDVKHTYISKLPHSIWKMQRLRHLYLSESYRSRFEHKPRNVSSLEELQTLWGVFVDERSPVKHGLDKLENLRKLGLACRTMLSQKKQMLLQIDAIADWIRKLKHLQSLRLRSFDEHGEAWFLPLKHLSELGNLSSMNLLGRLQLKFVKFGVPKGLTYLTLSASRMKEDPMQILQYLHNLKELKLLSNSYLGKKMHCPLGSFLQLQVLKMWKLEHLQQWTVENGALRQLRELEIRFCRKLVLPKEVQCMRNLEILKLEGMDFEDRMHCSNISFPQLQVLKLANLTYLQIWTVDEGAFPQLRELQIISCRQLKMLPEGLEHMTSLKVLKVREMPSEFTSRIQENHGLDWYKIANIPTRELE